MNQIFYLYYIALRKVGGALKGNLSNIKIMIDPTPTQHILLWRKHQDHLQSGQSLRHGPKLLLGDDNSVPIAKLTNGPPSFECMVNIPVCTWNPITPANTDVSTLLTEVMKDCYLPEVCSTFAQGGCINPEISRVHIGERNVPRGYLGWAALQAGMTQDLETSIRGIICNDKSGNW